MDSGKDAWRPAGRKGVKSLDGQGGIMTSNVSGRMGMSLFLDGPAAKSRFAAKIAVTPGPCGATCVEGPSARWRQRFCLAE